MAISKAGWPPCSAAAQPLEKTRPQRHTRNQKYQNVSSLMHTISSSHLHAAASMVMQQSTPPAALRTRDILVPSFVQSADSLPLIATTARNTVWDEQPTPLKPMLLSPRQAHSPYNNNNPIDSAFNHQDIVRPISERPPSIKPFDFGQSSLIGRMSLHGRRKSSTTLMKRISGPTEFRRLEYTDKQRMSLKPLQLEPVVLKTGSMDLLPHGEYLDLTTPLPEYVMGDDPHSYRTSRGTPWERCQQLAASATSSSPTAIVTERGEVSIQASEKSKPKRPTLSSQSSSSSMISLRRQAMEFGVSGASTPSRPSSSEKARIKRKRSYQRGSRESNDFDIDREILELNTIVEERRAEAARPQSPANSHVPAVAPRMPVRARSETLTDIGSVFSRPLLQLSTTAAVPEEADQLASGAEGQTPSSPVKSRLSRPFMSMPDPIIVQAEEQQQQQQHIRRPSSKITGWLSSLLSSSQTTSAFTARDHDTVPATRYGTASETSLCTDQESSSFHTTNASSPVSRGHSRSVTVETPISPPSTVDEAFQQELTRSKTESDVDSWPVMSDQVGLAL